MMCIAEDFAVVCLDAVDDKKEAKNLVRHLKEDEKEIIRITEAQVNSFAGNMLQVAGKDGKKFLVMSAAAYSCLTDGQITAITKYCEILSVPLDVIEACGGGSARCMMAEIFLEKDPSQK